MRDSAGRAIVDCLEPHIYSFSGAYYAYGFTVRSPASPANNGPNFTVSIYRSPDLRAWERMSTIPMVGDRMPPFNVLFNARSGQYVGFGQVYGKSVSVYTAPAPEGPFTFSHSMSPLFHDPGDMLVFGEGASAWLLYNSYDGAVLQRFTFIYELTVDFYDIVPSSIVNTTAVCEGLWVVHDEASRLYYLLGSGLVGFNVDDDFYLTAPSMAGPWTRRGYIAPVGSNTFESQVFQGLSITGAKGTVRVFIGHRWKGRGPDYAFPNATSIWLPIEFNLNGSITQMTYVDAWTLDTDGVALATAA